MKNLYLHFSLHICTRGFTKLFLDYTCKSGPNFFIANLGIECLNILRPQYLSIPQYLYLPLPVVAVEGAPVVADSPHDEAGAGASVGSDDAPGVLAPVDSSPPLLTNITVRRMSSVRMARTSTRRQMNLMRECFDALFNFTSTLCISLWMSSIFCLWIPASFPPVLS